MVKSRLPLKSKLIKNLKAHAPTLRLYRLYSWVRTGAMRPVEYFDLNPNLLFLRVATHTMVSYRGLRNVYDLAQDVERRNLSGDFVECGVWRGGSAGIMAYVAGRAGGRRKTHLFDSFEGLPEPSAIDGDEALDYAGNSRTSGRLVSIEKCVGQLQDVEHLLFKMLHLRPESVVFHKGWFQDTIPKFMEKPQPISLLRLDADWYESTRICLVHLYDLVVPGGYVVIDDYLHWKGCKQAVDEFLSERSINATLHPIDNNVVFFQKHLE